MQAPIGRLISGGESVARPIAPEPKYGHGMSGWSRVARVETWQWITAATVGLVVWMTVDEIRHGAVPLTDNAMIEVRALDVFSSHPPITNMLSTVAIDRSVSHPGPLLFYILALPVRLGSHGNGLTLEIGRAHV